MSTQPVCWPRLLSHLAAVLGPAGEPLGTRALSAALNVPRGTLRCWLDGAEPAFSTGERLIVIWCHATGLSCEDVPREKRSLSAAEVA